MNNVLSLTLITISSYILITAETYIDFLNSGLLSTPIIFAIVGGILFLLSLLGCCGTFRKDPCVIFTYSILLFVLILVQVIINS